MGGKERTGLRGRAVGGGGRVQLLEGLPEQGKAILRGKDGWRTFGERRV